MWRKVKISALVAPVASQAAHASEKAEGIDLQSALQTLRSTLSDITYDFVGHTPYILAGLVVLLLTWGMSFVVSRVVVNMSKRSTMRGSLRDLLQRLTSILVWLLGLLLTAMVIFPGLTPASALGGLGLASVAIGFAFKEIANKLNVSQSAIEKRIIPFF